MNKRRLLAGLTALILCVCVTAVALGEGQLGGLVDSLHALAFDTHNVTIEGEAVFTCDGERFKSAQLRYVQDDDDSFYQLRLQTPVADSDEDLETGWIIIANSEDIYVMEAFYPGSYKEGSDGAQNTPLRRTVEMEAMFGLARTLSGVVEASLPEGAITVSRTEGGVSTHIVLTEDQVPALVNSGLTMAGQYAGARFFGVPSDRNFSDLEYAIMPTVTTRILNTTVSYSLESLDVTVTTDAQGRLSGVSGEITVKAVSDQGEITRLGAAFSGTVSGWGTSHVAQFDPEDYDVIPFRQWIGQERPWQEVGEQEFGPEPDSELHVDESEAAEWVTLAAEALTRQGYRVSENPEHEVIIQAGVVAVRLEDNGHLRCAFDAETHALMSVYDLNAPWLAHLDTRRDADLDPETLNAADALIRAFVARENPLLAETLGVLTVNGMYVMEDGTRYLELMDPLETGALFVVRLDPDMSLDYFSVESNG